MTQQPQNVSTQARGAAVLAHLSAPIAAIVSAGWLAIVGPLVVWLFSRNNSQFVRIAAAGAFNFQISAWVMSVLGWILCFTVILLPIGILLIVLGNLLTFILGIWGAVRTSGGYQYKYPWQIPILH
ncbi:DUF4870 domain-containing protein [Gulosibacter sp. ACHW.36C]|uniref:DUF4870 domain-containing protein n=1 Tax=Gulosibacter sediminis TaxID=1729695 RepID=A0ABY4MU62_9MICO|nr:DUF4870 domain-containing protein [Gulosibacter sediminis]UQN13950.1 DUF4870 domain-containing protein [Gulosibacter sediminis]